MSNLHEDGDLVSLIRSLREARERLRLEIERTRLIREKYARRAASLLERKDTGIVRRPAEGSGC